MIKYGRCYLKYEHRLSNEEAQTKIHLEGDYTIKDLLEIIEDHVLFLKDKKPKSYVSKKQKENIFDKFNRVCAICGAPEGKGLHVHHIIPVSQGGTNDESNLMLVCKECHHRIHKKK